MGRRGRQQVAQAENLQPGARDGAAELTPNLHTLEDLWNEWKFGLGGRKAAQQFTPTERGGHGHRGKKMKYCRRKKIWSLQQKLVDEGRSPAEANHEIREAYGRSLSITALSEAIKRLPVHPNIRPPHVGRIQARANQARANPPLNPPPAPRGRGRGNRRGGAVALIPGQRRLGPNFRPPTVPRLNDGNAVLQGMLANATLERETGVQFFDVPHAPPNPNHAI